MSGRGLTFTITSVGNMQISEAESRVMEVLWKRGACTAEDVVVALRDSSQWQEPTIKTLLSRLMKKGAIHAEAEGRRYRYRPVLKQSDWVQEESSSLLQRLFDGRIAPFVATSASAANSANAISTNCAS